MKEEEKVKMKINIAGEQFMLSVPYSQQEETRKTEAEVNVLFQTWKSRFPEKGTQELLSMIAFRYAERYSGLLRENEDARRDIDEISKKVDSLIAGHF